MHLATPQLACNGLPGVTAHHTRMRQDPAGNTGMHEYVTRIAATVAETVGHQRIAKTAQQRMTLVVEK